MKVIGLKFITSFIKFLLLSCSLFIYLKINALLLISKINKKLIVDGRWI